jgi:predicted TIM-barrel fold metal-dependent hydrolase
MRPVSGAVSSQILSSSDGFPIRVANNDSVVRVNLERSQNRTEISEVVRKTTEVAKQMNWALDLYTPISSLTYLHDYIAGSGVTFVSDHFGHTPVGSKTNVSMNTYDPYRTPGFRELIDLVRRKLMFVKISGLYRDSNQAPLYEDMRIVAETIMNAGPDMVVYASDWPHTPVGGGLQVQDFQDINDAALLEITKDWAGSQAQIQRLFVDNPRRLWQWYEDS